MDQQSLRKAIGALKDSTTVGLVKVNSDYKELDIAIVKATSHVEMLAKEKYIQTIFSAISASRPRADVAYCINALARRLAKTHNWAVAIKTLIVIHRAFREVDATFQEELMNFTMGRSHMLNLCHFKDKSSPNAWDYSSWVRNYALYIEERLECFRIVKYDVETGNTRTLDLDTVNLLEHLPSLQQLLLRLLSCQPEGAAIYNSVIQYALSIVASESTKIYNAITGCTLNLVDKFFEMQRNDALRALEIYRKAGYQPDVSFIDAMEQYVKDALRTQPANLNMVDANKRLPAPKSFMGIEHKKVDSNDDKQEAIAAVSVSPEQIAAETPKASVPAQTEVPDLLGLDDASQGAAELEENNTLALAVVPSSDPLDSTSADLMGETTGWELALVTASTSNRSAIGESKLAGGLDKATLDSLYNDAISRRANYHLGQVAPNPFHVSQFSRDPFYASNGIAAPANVQMATMGQQQAVTMQGQRRQQQQSLGQENTNPFGNPFGPADISSYPHQNPYNGLM
ncbi:putative clathrin assembly protein At5g35200 isoform X2 [Asparagus officinalis]|uniref:putative clathrin assembly protein At5g35200 isoform X2 n=1 Tax=Asparagus officinalis TaxID=4686 RepID=UPI00098DEFEF|nr:putative clathrin assembly protein At5g35200 isoform X2 [Asparagus officinalis]